MEKIEDLFVRATVDRLREEYLPRVRRALDTLPDDALWWRPHEDVTSFGNLLLHLAGNVRQWIISGIGGAPDHRVRAQEFRAREGGTASELYRGLEDTVVEACAVIEGLTGDDLGRTYSIQGDETTGLEAVYHVLEHFGWHTGQMVWMAKAKAGPGHGLAFYEDDTLDEIRNRQD